MYPMFRTLTMTVAMATGIALSPVSSAATPASGAASTQAIQLGDFMGRLRSIEVTVGGQRGTFLLDTGSGVSFMTPEFAKRAGCEPWGRMTGFRLTGERLDLPRCDGVAMTLGDGRALKPMTTGVLDLKSVLPPGAPAADGSLALDALDGQVFTLDLRAGTLEFVAPKSLAQRTAGAIEIPIRVSRYSTSGHGVGVSARMKTAKGDLWLEIDSGGGAPVLLRNVVASDAGANAEQAQPQPYTLKLSGKKGDVVLPTRAIVRDMIHDGVVGMPVLVNWQITFDLAGDRMWVAPAKR